MHEQNSLSSWLREDVESRAEEEINQTTETKTEEDNSGKRKVGRETERVEVNGLLDSTFVVKFVKCFPFRRLGVFRILGFILSVFLVFATCLFLLT